MAYSFNGTSQYLSVGSAAATAAPLTMACWFYVTDVNANRCCVSVCNNSAGATSFHSIILNVTTRSVSLVGNNAGTIASATNAGTDSYSLGTWNHLCGVVASNSSRTVYLNGVSVGSSTVTSTVSGVNSQFIGGRWANNAIAQLMTGQLADVGIWNVALTAAEISSLAKGIACDLVRPQSLAFYAPLVNQIIDVRGGRAITNNGSATVAAHPRIYA